MARWKDAAAVLDAAKQWKQRCLIEGQSLFTDERLWTRARFEQLRTYFVERPDSGSDPFEEKLRRQLDPAPPEAKRLWAEMTWAYDLIANNIKRVTKLDRIRTVWEWSGTSLPEEHWALGEVLEHGVSNPGPAWNTHRWRELGFIVTLMIAWFSLSAEERKTQLAEPWRLAEWIDRQEGSNRRQFRHAVLYLLFPDSFEYILTTRHKRDVIEAFRGQQDNAPSIGQMKLVDLDRELLAIRERLETEHPNVVVDFYESPFKEDWRSSSASTSRPEEDGAGTDDEDAESWYRKRFGAADVWVIAPGEGARLWWEFREQRIAAIGYDEGGGLGDLGEYDSREAVHRALIENGTGKNPSNHSLAVWEFSHEIKVGDYLIAKRGRSVILGWGEVTGDYRYEPDRPEYRHVRDVDWHACRNPLSLGHLIATKTLTRFTPYREWLRNTFRRIDRPERPVPKPEPYDIVLALGDLFVDDGQFRRILDSIALRKNLILQGPPGVGKTFIAKRIAWCLIRRKDSRPIEMVQFHQSYAYEDFVQGWRPNEEGGFTLRNGVFFEFCKRAEQEPETPFVFIIDEINRGNLSRIFGELLMLIESDKRGPDHAIRLTYGKAGECFSVPDNVHLLGLMNTADRSLAMVDYALRRRFAFETLRPAYGAKFREYLLEADVERALIDRIVRNMSNLNDDIRKDKDLGPGFEIGHSYFVPDESADADEQWYRNVVDTQIAPLLREYWFDRSEYVDRLIENLRQ